MKKYFFSQICVALAGISFLLATSAIILPSVVFAQTPAPTTSSNPQDSNFQIVPCQGPAGYNIDPTTQQASSPCDFEALILLVQRIINLLIYSATFIAVLSIVWAGFIYLTAGGDTGKTKKAKEIFKVTAIGFAIALCSWLIVYTVITAVIDTNAYPNVTSLLGKQ